MLVFIKINLSPVILTLFLTMHHHTELHISMNNHPCQKPADSPENLQCKHSLWKVEHFGPCTESIILNQHRLKDCINIEYISFQTDMNFCISNWNEVFHEIVDPLLWNHQELVWQKKNRTYNLCKAICKRQYLLHEGQRLENF